MSNIAPTCRNQITLKRRNDIIGSLRVLNVHRQQHNSLPLLDRNTDTKSLFLWYAVFGYIAMMFSVQVHAYDVQCSGTCPWCSVFRYMPTMFSVQVPAHGVRCSGTCPWCSVFRYVPMMVSVQVPAYDVQCSGTYLHRLCLTLCAIMSWPTVFHIILAYSSKTMVFLHVH